MNSSFTFGLSVDHVQPSRVESRGGRDELCHLCRRMVEQSKIISSPAKWSHADSDNDDDSAGAIHVHVPILSSPQSSSIPKLEVFDHHNTLGALKMSAKRCHLCALLSAYDSSLPELVNESSDYMIYTMKVFRADMHADGPGVLKIDLRRGVETGATYLMHGKPRDKVQSTLDCMRTNDFRVLSLAKEWLQKCLSEHDGCNRRSHPTSGWHLPTRLVQVTGFMTSVFSMKLCLGKDLPPGTRYLTLSHCWGGADILKLTQDTLQSFRSGIPLEDLPRNFKDAAAVTLFLGYQYLWIDSLCIVQDSIEDWDQEAKAMGDVYRYSVCTIAAVAATNPHDGFFVERESRSFLPCQLVPKSPGRSEVYAENWRRQAGPEVLSTRGWVYQERALSPRTLYFGTMMVSWHCTTSSTSEIDTVPDSSSLNSYIKKQFYDLLDTAKTKGHDGWGLAWWKIVAEYTICDLSFDSDRWPAVFGLANMIERQSGLKLVHGLWGVSLATELMWKVSNPRKGKRIDNGTPSWSWLSLTSGVSKMGYNLNGYFRMDAAVALQTHPEDHKCLFVRGRMAKLKWTIRYHGDGRRDHCYRCLAPGRSEIGAWDGHWSPDVTPDEEWEIWLLEFVTDDRVREAAGLVVRREEKSTGDAWTRVGSYSLMPAASRGDDPAWDILRIQTITLT